eukprot:CAMPEP_0116845022 /NCGR_PEP_ID=MMETSP0418-20121206/13028_1 /TAXON_ID=1158023 /ORGANISM="Astrosyne radiata, Strain 13vi08-1A" /LENGTH=380 /DNA_ID=CAMNT_0004476071 /DNA_START=978 /DNA_END=2120 /DNA_ORIENTATION=-
MTMKSTKTPWLVVSSAIAIVAAAAVFYKIAFQDDDPKDDKQKVPRENDKNKATAALEMFMNPHQLREFRKQVRRREMIPLLSRKSPMYDNVQMLDPQGSLLCTISTKKAQWYLAKGLAKQVSPSLSFQKQKMKAIQLLFEPEGRSSQAESYTLSPKQNICVACGKEKHLQRHYIVPCAYRSLFPAKYKSHLSSHDIVLLCFGCRSICEQIYQERIKQLEEEQRDHHNDSDKRFHIDRHLYQIRNRALALLRWKSKLPPEKQHVYEQDVQNYLATIEGDDKKKELTDNRLQKVIDEIVYNVPNPSYIPGPQLVVKSLEEDPEMIQQFVWDWRQLFLDTLAPRHLPDGWRMDSPVVNEKSIRKHRRQEKGEDTAQQSRTNLP